MKSIISTIMILLIVELKGSRLLQQTVCTRDTKKCPDGSYVGRDENINCAFRKCPPCPTNQCIHPTLNQCRPIANCIIDPCSNNNGGCDKGKICYSNYCGGCHALCGDPVQGDSCGVQGVDCTALKAPSFSCSDGTCYGNCGGCTYQADTNGDLQCEPELVAKEDVCPCAGLLNCERYTPDGCNICDCPKDGSNPICTASFCPLDKQKPECRKCTDDVKKCAEGSFVSRDPANDCEFKPCPASCCDPLMSSFPANPICREGCACCPDGSWSGSIGDGKTFNCGGQQCTEFGEETCGGTICELKPDCSAVTCIKPKCKTSEKLVTPKEKCCPVCVDIDDP